MDNIYTDLASEFISKIMGREKNNIKSAQMVYGDITVKSFEIDKHSSDLIHRPQGLYVIIETGPDIRGLSDSLSDTIGREIKKLIEYLDYKKKPEKILVVGLGNREITSDSIGPRVIDKLRVTGHVKENFPEEFARFNSIYALAPGVMAQTGMETAGIVKGITDKLMPELIICIDALATQSMERICTTLQLSTAGISPGSGIGNLRNAINPDTMGVPVITVGVPTVVGAVTLVRNYLEELENACRIRLDIDKLDICNFNSVLKDKYVTTKNIDEEVSCLSEIVSMAINGALLKK